jgi:hypothetical protein
VTDGQPLNVTPAPISAIDSRMARNLIYVAVSRAMDNLNVFTLEDPKEQPIRDLVEAVGEAGVP